MSNMEKDIKTQPGNSAQRHDNETVAPLVEAQLYAIRPKEVTDNLKWFA